jgi:hypothetical protein
MQYSERKSDKPTKLDSVELEMLPVVIRTSESEGPATAIKFTLSRKQHASFGEFKDAVLHALVEDMIEEGVSISKLNVEVLCGAVLMTGVAGKWSEYLDEFLSPPSKYHMRGALCGLSVPDVLL